MTQRRSERPGAGRGVSRATPGRGRRTPPMGHASQDSGGTFVLFGHQGAFPADPGTPVHALEPPASDLNRLKQEDRLPSDRAPGFGQTQPLPSARAAHGAAEWQRAAHALSTWLGERLARGSVNVLEEEAIARLWTAFTLGGTSAAQILRVAHVVQRAHAAIRTSPRGNTDLQSAYQAAAGVLHKALPTAIRERMPMERALLVVRRLRDEADAWRAIVSGTSDLLGWHDFAQFHAAATLRAFITHYREP